MSSLEKQDENFTTDTAVLLAAIISVPAVLPYVIYLTNGTTVLFSPSHSNYRGITVFPITVSFSRAAGSV